MEAPVSAFDEHIPQPMPGSSPVMVMKPMEHYVSTAGVGPPSKPLPEGVRLPGTILPLEIRKETPSAPLLQLTERGRWAVSTFKKGEEAVAQKITRPLLGDEERIATGIVTVTRGPERIRMPSLWFAKPPIKEEKEFVKGEIVGLREKPLTTAATTGAFMVAPMALGPVARGAAWVGKVTRTPKAVGTGLGAAFKWGLPTAYAGTVGYRVAIAEKPFFKLGEITSTELAPMAAGGYLGATYIPRVRGYFATRGLPEVPTKELVPAEVIAGKKTFPTAPRRKHLQLFLRESKRLPDVKEPTMYHATGERFWGQTFEAAKGTSEFYGLYGSYGISPHFLRVQAAKTFYGGGLTQPYGKPGVLAIVPKGFVRGKTAPPGRAFVPGKKTEVEAILPPGTTGVVQPQKYFFRWRKERVPISVARVTGAGVSRGERTIVRISSSYRPSKYPVTTPSSYAYGVARSSYYYGKPSKVSYKYKYKPSKYPGYKVSKPSYPPSKMPPSYPPSYPPSKYPPSKPPSYPPSYPPYKFPPGIPPPVRPPIAVKPEKIKKPKKPIRPYKTGPRPASYKPSLRGLGLKPGKFKTPKLLTGLEPRRVKL